MRSYLWGFGFSWVSGEIVLKVAVKLAREGTRLADANAGNGFVRGAVIQTCADYAVIELRRLGAFGQC